MSPPASPAPFSHSTPSTPPLRAPQMSWTLPTPRSFSSHRRTQSHSSPGSACTITPPSSKDIRGLTFARVDETGQSSGVYRVPQRQRRDAIDEESVLGETGVEAPRPSTLGKAGSASKEIARPFRLDSPLSAPTRFGPTLGKGMHEGSSIWSAGRPSNSGAGFGWLSPVLGVGTDRTATISTSATRRGLTIAVLKDDNREMVLGDLPLSAGSELGSGRINLRSEDGTGGIHLAEHEQVEGEKPTAHKEVILCRYFHTPGMTCTSRPCRFVHSLGTLAILSPRTEGPTSYSDSPLNTDPTSGTFAHAQAEVLDPRGSVNSMVSPGGAGRSPVGQQHERGNGDQEVAGTVFLMGGGGKGPAGIDRLKYKTVPCKDFAEGHCPYREYCSFIHDEKLLRKSDSNHSEEKDRAARGGEIYNSIEGRADSRHRELSAPPLSAWSRPLPASIKSRFGESDDRDPQSALGHTVPKDTKEDSPYSVPGHDASAHTKRHSLAALSSWPEVLPEHFATRSSLSAAADERGRSSLATSTGVSAPSPPFLQPPVQHDDVRFTREGISPLSRLHVPRVCDAPRTSVWLARSRPTLRTGAGTDMAPFDAPATPTSASGARYLAPPVSAVSLYGTESDPATPWDPALRKKRSEELGEGPVVHNGYKYDYDDGYARGSTGADNHVGAGARARAGTGAALLRPPPTPMEQGIIPYPWGMPMSMSRLLPATGQNGDNRGEGGSGSGSGIGAGVGVGVGVGTSDGGAATFAGDPGVLWTPSGWAVQDAAMKLSMRSAEDQAMGRMSKRRGKSYYKTRPCKFFLEGHCPRGSSCTYIHERPSVSESSTTSTSDSTDRSTSTAPTSTSASSAEPTLTSDPSSTSGAGAKRHPHFRTIPCKFFNSAQGCHAGSACSFLHTRVVPLSAPLVDKPRPWRTRPCRHYQVGRCTLGEACHFAHVFVKPDSADSPESGDKGRSDRDRGRDGDRDRDRDRDTDTDRDRDRDRDRGRDRDTDTDRDRDRDRDKARSDWHRARDWDQERDMRTDRKEREDRDAWGTMDRGRGLDKNDSNANPNSNPNSNPNGNPTSNPTGNPSQGRDVSRENQFTEETLEIALQAARLRAIQLCNADDSSDEDDEDDVEIVTEDTTLHASRGRSFYT